MCLGHLYTLEGAIHDTEFNRLSEDTKKELKEFRDFLYEAIFIPKGMDKPLRSIIEQPEMQVYIKDFEKADDWCFASVIAKLSIIGKYEPEKFIIAIRRYNL